MSKVALLVGGVCDGEIRQVEDGVVTLTALSRPVIDWTDGDPEGPSPVTVETVYWRMRLPLPGLGMELNVFAAWGATSEQVAAAILTDNARKALS